MDYEKKYKEALERAEVIYQGSYKPDTAATIAETLQNIFPELVESKDERIRKALIRFHKSTIDVDGIKGEDIIAWLEKQVPIDEDEIVKGIRRGVAISLMNHIDANSKGMCLSNMECEDIENAIVNEDWDKVYCYIKKKLERQVEKPQGKSALEAINEEKVDNANKIEPKFKVGDWVVLDRPVLITKVEDMPYNTHQYWTSDGTWFGDATKSKLWTIQDAKDGDVLAEAEDCIFIIRKLGDNLHAAKTYFTLYDDGDFDNGTILNFDADAIHPATKEQRDLLFQKMKEEGYEWDEEKKELKKIEQKPAWSETDKLLMRLDKIVDCNIDQMKCLNNIFDKLNEIS